MERNVLNFILQFYNKRSTLRSSSVDKRSNPGDKQTTLWIKKRAVLPPVECKNFVEPISTYNRRRPWPALKFVNHTYRTSAGRWPYRWEIC